MFINKNKYIGFVVGIQNKNEADLLITFFTKEKGKIIFLAKGARKIKSKTLGKFDYLNWLEVECIEKDENTIAVLISASRINNRNIAWSQCAIHFVSECIYKMCPIYQPYVSIYNMIAEYYLKRIGYDEKIYLQLFYLLLPIARDIGYDFPNSFISECKILSQKQDKNKHRMFFYNICQFVFQHTNVDLQSIKYINN